MLLKKKKKKGRQGLRGRRNFSKIQSSWGKHWGWLGQKQPAIMQYIDQKYNFILESYSVYFISQCMYLSDVKMFGLAWVLPRTELEINTWFGVVSLEIISRGISESEVKETGKVENSIKAYYKGVLLNCWGWLWELNVAKTSGVVRKCREFNKMSYKLSSCNWFWE